MRSFNPFTSVSGRYALFEIRLDNDFIVFRGNEHEAAGQLLKGTVVLCLTSPLRVDNIHLKLTGTVHYAWTDAKITATGVSTHKTDKTLQFFEHRWAPFVGVGASEDNSRQHTKSVTLPPGNYEWPFELLLGGDTTESVEGLREASIRYKLKATVARGKLMHDIHAYKQLRVIRTLDASALEFLHAMSIENIWPNKIEYSIVVPQKAIVFGSSVPVEMRFTPLLKGLELGDITIKLMETHDIILYSPTGHNIREHKKERQIESWTIPVTREEHWRDIIDDDNGPEGWLVNSSLDLPKKLSKCLQDANVKGIKIRHKLKLVVALNNPDGHVSELRATLPITIFISPNMPLDEQGNLVRQLPSDAARESATTMAPPSYTDHRLDQLYEDIDPISLHSPIGGRSGVASPLLGHSRAGSTDNLPALMQSASIQPDLLAHRLHSMSLEQRHRNASWNSNLSAAGGAPHAGDDSHVSPPPSAPLTRHNSGDGPSGSNTPPEHIDFPEISELSRVPSYQTAVRTPIRPLGSDMFALPDYQTALSAPSSRPGSPRLHAAAAPSPIDSLDTVTELAHESTMLPTPADESAAEGHHHPSPVEVDVSTTTAPALASPAAAPPAPAPAPAPAAPGVPVLSSVSAPVSREPSPPPSYSSSSRRPAMHRRQFSSGFSLSNVLHIRGEGDETRRVHLLQARSG